jgi:drug/metabolite transporter (DMT)-like permease
MLSILFGLGAAAGWGAGDFMGGLVSRRVSAVRAALYIQAFGFIPAVVIALFANQMQLSLANWLWCGSAGVIGSLGFVALYRALADGQMSTAAPVASIVSAGLPVIVGVWQDGLPSKFTLIGFALALAAIWFVSQSSNENNFRLQFKQLILPLLAGLGFGIYFIFVNKGSQTSLFAPLVAVRSAGAIALTLFAAFNQELHLPSKNILPLVLLNTLFDFGGSVFFILAGQSGRMDVAAVLGSLYSGATVLLAWIILREKISRSQWAGIALALMAIILITL